MQYLCTDLAGGLNDSRLMGMILPSGRIEEYDYSSNQLVLTSITSIGTTATATYIGTNDQMFDSDGNTLTNSGSNAGYTYNAWNEMTSASIEGGASTYYDYNALGQRIGSESSPGMPDAIEYYSTAGQVVETDQVTWTSIGLGSGSVMFVPSVSTFTQDVWGLGYVNDLVEEDSYAVSGFTGSTLTSREYAIRDANHGVTGTTANAAGGAVTQRMQYDSYGSQTVLNSSYGAISVGPNTLVGFQGGLMDGLTGLVHFDARDYDPVTGVWMEQDPIGYAGGGADVYQFVESNPVTFADPTGLYLAAFDGTWDRKQGAKDGPGIGNNGNHTVIQQFVERDTDPHKDYHAGVGTGGWIPGAILGGVFGIGSFTMVDEAFDKIKEYYSKKENQCDPVDIIGYSRGAYAALLLAQKVSEGIDEPGGKFHPKIRFIGLVSPVAQMALPNPFFSLHMGFPDQPPKGTELFVQALETDGSNPIFRQDKLSAPDGVKHEEKEFDYSKVPGLQHQLIGSDSNVLDWLITEAQSVKVPVK